MTPQWPNAAWLPNQCCAREGWGWGGRYLRAAGTDGRRLVVATGTDRAPSSSCSLMRPRDASSSAVRLLSGRLQRLGKNKGDCYITGLPPFEFGGEGMPGGKGRAFLARRQQCMGALPAKSQHHAGAFTGGLRYRWYPMIRGKHALAWRQQCQGALPTKSRRQSMQAPSAP